MYKLNERRPTSQQILTTSKRKQNNEKSDSVHHINDTLYLKSSYSEGDRGTQLHLLGLGPPCSGLAPCRILEPNLADLLSNVFKSVLWSSCFTAYYC